MGFFSIQKEQKSEMHRMTRTFLTATRRETAETENGTPHTPGPRASRTPNREVLPDTSVGPAFRGHSQSLGTSFGGPLPCPRWDSLGQLRSAQRGGSRGVLLIHQMFQVLRLKNPRTPAEIRQTRGARLRKPSSIAASLGAQHSLRSG